MVNEGECVCVCVCMWRCGCCVRACVTVYRGFVMAGFATLYDTSGPSWTSKTTATPPILRNPPYVWVWRCFDRSRSHVRLRAFLGVQCGTADCCRLVAGPRSYRLRFQSIPIAGWGYGNALFRAASTPVQRSGTRDVAGSEVLLDSQWHCSGRDGGGTTEPAKRTMGSTCNWWPS